MKCPPQSSVDSRSVLRLYLNKKNAPFDMILKDSKALFGFSFQPWLSRCARDPGGRIAGAPRHPRLETEPRPYFNVIKLQI